jgi:hypothetical protein
MIKKGVVVSLSPMLNRRRTPSFVILQRRFVFSRLAMQCLKFSLSIEKELPLFAGNTRYCS